MATTGAVVNKLNIYEKRDDSEGFFKRNTVPLKMLGHCKWPTETMIVPFRCMAASATLK